MPALLSDVESDTAQDANRKSCDDPARPEALSMSGILLHRSWVVSSVPVPRGATGAGKACSHNPAIPADEKSGTPILPKRPTNKGAEAVTAVEGRGVAKRNAGKIPHPGHRAGVVVRPWVLTRTSICVTCSISGYTTGESNMRPGVMSSSFAMPRRYISSGTSAYQFASTSRFRSRSL